MSGFKGNKKADGSTVESSRDPSANLAASGDAADLVTLQGGK